MQTGNGESVQEIIKEIKSPATVVISIIQSISNKTVHPISTSTLLTTSIVISCMEKDVVLGNICDGF